MLRNGASGNWNRALTRTSVNTRPARKMLPHPRADLLRFGLNAPLVNELNFLFLCQHKDVSHNNLVHFHTKKKSQSTSHSLPSLASYGVSIVIFQSELFFTCDIEVLTVFNVSKILYLSNFHFSNQTLPKSTCLLGSFTCPKPSGNGICRAPVACNIELYIVSDKNRIYFFVAVTSQIPMFLLIATRVWGLLGYTLI